jgi:hypothetical protein
MGGKGEYEYGAGEEQDGRGTSKRQILRRYTGASFMKMQSYPKEGN